MKTNLQRLLVPLTPFILIGMVIAFFIGVMIVFSYVLMWGLLIGGILWLSTTIKNYFFPKKMSSKTPGRIIEHDERH